MTARRSGRRTAASVGRKRTVARQVGRRQSGKTDALSAAERLRLIRLVTCGGIFVLLVAAKLLLPGRMAGVSQKLSEAMTRSVDVQAVFSAVGGLFTKDGTPAEAADEVYRAVFHPEGAETRQTAARTADGAALTELRNWRDAEPLNTIPPAGEDPAPEELETMDLVLYSDEDLPENVSMRQAILGFDHETPVKGVLSSNFGYRDHPLEGTERFHYGVDLAADTGTAIACFADGTVTAVGESSSYGKYCTVTHANGCATLYAHCGRISVSSGAAVKKGEKLGEVGETGMAQPPKPYEFRSKPAGQRLMIMVAGVVFNFLLALFIYSMILFTWGDTYLPLKNMKMGMNYSETFQNVGFQDGDILLRADNEELERFGSDSFRKVVEAKTVTVLRDGRETVISIPEDMMQRCMRDGKGFADPLRIPMVVRELPDKNAPAALAGMLPKDSVVAINGVATPTFYDASGLLSENKGEEVTVDFYRNGQLESLTMRTDSAGKIGVAVMLPTDLYQTVTREYGFFESFPAGIKLGINTLKGYVNDMKYVFTKEGASSLGGFGTIGGLFPSVWDWRIFWERTAFLSIILAFMNILPIPALDGGHVMFLIYEVVARRKPSDKFLEYAQMAGMFILFALLIYANGNDIFRFFFK